MMIRGKRTENNMNSSLNVPCPEERWKQSSYRKIGMSSRTRPHNDRNDDECTKAPIVQRCFLTKADWIMKNALPPLRTIRRKKGKPINVTTADYWQVFHMEN